MECTRQVEFRSATASSDSAACVQPGFHTASSGSDCGYVHIRNSRFPERVVDVPFSHWCQLVDTAQATGRVDLTVWFPPAEYGDFADTFTEAERAAFEQGVLANEPHITGQVTYV
jgi:hypothetical protein